MSAIDDEIQKASQLTLYDAAYYLWDRHHALNQIENPPQQIEFPDEGFNSPEQFRKQMLPIFKRVAARLRFEHDNAKDGATFYRLKMAHPSFNADEIKAAIDATLKLRRDSDANFVYTGKLVDDAYRAARIARENNPGFTDESYLQEGTRLCKENR